MNNNFGHKNKPFKLPVFYISLLSGFSVSPAFADASMDTVLVTATRTAQTANETVSSVSVIDREEIERQQAKSLPDLLRGLPGIYFASNGGRGQLTSLFMRGTNSDHVIVLVDGIKIGSATAGTVPFQNLAIDQIERIEIVRGPRSSLYGSEAIGGVIQIFTRRGQGEAKPFASVGLGSRKTYEASAGISGSHDRLSYNVSLSGERTRGFDACDEKAATEFGGCFADQDDKDAYKSVSGSLSLAYALDNGSEVSLFASENDGKSEFDGNFQDSSETKQRVLGARADLVMSDIWLSSLRAGRSQDRSDNEIDGDDASRFDTKRDTVSWQNDVQVASNTLVSVGVDFQRDKVSASEDYDKTKRDNTGIFAQSLFDFDVVNLELSLRHDDDEEFGGELTGGVGAAYRISEDLRVVSSYGWAYTAPTFNQLYFPGFGVDSLKPEKSRSFELGLKGGHARQSWSATFFHTRIDDLIGFDSGFNQKNIDKADIRGLELALTQQLGSHWLLASSINLMDPVNKSEGANKGKTLARRPERTARIDLDYIADDWSAGTSYYTVGTRFDDQANNRKLSAYDTLDLRASYNIYEDFLLQGRIENVFDSDYETAAFYNQPGRSVYVTLRYQP